MSAHDVEPLPRLADARYGFVVAMASGLEARPAARTTRLAVAGLLLGIAGVVGYFLIVFHLAAWLPGVRNYAIPNWIAIAVGLVLSLAAVARAGGRRRVLPALLLVLNLLATGAFAAILYVVPVVPAVPGPTIGAAAPDFSLVDQHGRTVRLADFRGAPLLIVFYRGHW